MVLADSTQFGLTEVTTDIFMDSVTCLGDEHKLIDCDYDTNHDCFHFEDVGIRCGQNSHTTNRMVVVHSASEYSVFS